MTLIGFRSRKQLDKVKKAPVTLEAVAFWAETAERVRDLLLAGRGHEIGPLLNENYDRRAAICRISEGNQRMVNAARALGASAKFTGSGGAIIGTYEDEAMYEQLVEQLTPLRIKVLRPRIVPPFQESPHDS